MSIRNTLFSALLALLVVGCTTELDSDFPEIDDPEEDLDLPHEGELGDPEESPLVINELDDDTTFYASYTTQVSCNEPPFGDIGSGTATAAINYSYHYVNFYGTRVPAARLENMRLTMRNYFTGGRPGGSQKFGLRWQYKIDGRWKHVYSVNDGWAWYRNGLGSPTNLYGGINQSVIMWDIPIRVQIFASWDRAWSRDVRKYCYLNFR
jgi:hypothetical protein